MKKSATIIAVCLMSIFCISTSMNYAVGQTYGDNDLSFGPYEDEEAYLPGELIDVVTPTIVAAPNPTSDAYLKVWYNQLEQTSKLTLNDISGKQIHVAQLGGENGKREGMYQIPVMNLPKGIYVVSLTSGIYKSTKKILIQ